MHLVEAAFLPQPRKSDDTVESFEHYLGRKVTALAAVLGWVVIECHGKPTREATVRGAELLAELVTLAIDEPRFHAVARIEGKAELHRQCRMNMVDLDEDWLDELVDEVLAMVTAVAKKVTN
jgi:hypothetical protein